MRQMELDLGSWSGETLPGSSRATGAETSRQPLKKRSASSSRQPRGVDEVMRSYIKQGDCLELMKTIPDGSVDAIIADPPYGIDYQSRRVPKDHRRPKIANDRTSCTSWIAEVPRILTQSGSLIVFFRWDVQGEFLAALDRAGLPAKNVCVWDKMSHGMGDLRRAFAPAHELFSFSPAPAFRFPGARPKSIVRAARVAPRALTHPNEKPVELLEQLIRAVTVPGDVVLDPFLGSGTTAVAAKRTGREYIGFELDPQYCEVARRRIAEVEADVV